LSTLDSHSNKSTKQLTQSSNSTKNLSITHVENLFVILFFSNIKLPFTFSSVNSNSVEAEEFCDFTYLQDYFSKNNDSIQLIFNESALYE
jgi:hypothetical protein